MASKLRADEDIHFQMCSETSFNEWSSICIAYKWLIYIKLNIFSGARDLGRFAKIPWLTTLSTLIHMSFLTSARPLSKNVLIYSRASKYALTSLRYLSSKKSENDASEDVSQAKKPLGAVLKKRSGARKDKVQPEASTISATKETTQCYIPFDKLPKPPKEITDMPLDKFYAKVYMRDLPERPEITPSNTFSYKFEIPSQFIRPKRLDQETPNQKSSFEPAHNILDFKIDYDNSGLMKAPDHPLKESITGMFVSNPLMNNIDNDFLWPCPIWREP